MKVMCDVKGCHHLATVRWWLPINVTLDTASGGKIALETKEDLIQLCEGHAKEVQFNA